ncbi:NUDIX domain-containing protein [Myceligenerans pegani]|uniref:NUDIX domain-containing protein n=1 Tax=Myceligenerans pegani TaxID=2776917 RepID=A0ABR9MX79_9MICO|nr:NUDIX domain-containing protein [Myceligenerans sp. TRM 65318]MBE1875998.1 NUDIX domain-containing protein [Myceligenerans sp. TRM 65318]MBE3018269.1 NUDIX domain-containing protein [Myceligenerans sp. TRM 65318]
MTVIDAWTGERATRLQAALRMSNDDFAAHLGIAPRTVAGWHQNPTTRPRPDVQRILDTALERAGDGARERFSMAMRAIEPDRDGEGPRQLTVAIAIVQQDESVLLVQRRDDGTLRWQFPAGIVKPGAAPADTAVRETFAETNVHCSVKARIGARVHPHTGVYCEYFHCEYLAGEAHNRDVVENASVTWAPIVNLTKFVPESSIYAPILDVLGGTHV